MPSRSASTAVLLLESGNSEYAGQLLQSSMKAKYQAELI